MTCKLDACTEKSTHSNAQPLIIGTIVGLGLLYYFVSKRK